MKKRLIVMNGQKVLQHYTNNEWTTSGKIKKAEAGIKPGIYNIYLAKQADTVNQVYEGILLFTDKEAGVVYQQVGKAFVTHKLDLFKSPLPVGKNVSIQYDDNQLILSKIEGIKKNRSRRV